MQVVVDDMLVNYTVEGEGDVVLMLHGWGDTLQTFSSLTAKLKSTYKIIRVDLPGFGKTETPKNTYNLQKYALFLQKFLQKTSTDNVYAIVGHSNGGAIAIKAVANNVIISEKLVLLASSGVRADTSGYKKLLRMTAKTAKIPTKLLPKNYQHKLRRKVYDKIGSDMFIAENMQETFKQIVSEDIVRQAGAITTDTLLIYGDEDTATPSAYGEAFHRVIKGSKLEIVPNTGHFLHHEKAATVDKLVEDFLRK